MPWKRRLSAVCQQLHPSSCSAASRQPGEPFFDPSVSVLRQAALVPEESCVIVIDMQNFNGDRNGAEGKALTVRPLPAAPRARLRWVPGVLVPAGAQGPENDHYWQELEGTATPNIAKIIEAAREKGIEVIYTVVESLTADGRDRGIDYKLSGFCALHPPVLPDPYGMLSAEHACGPVAGVPKGSWDGEVLPAIAPVGDEIVLPKGSSSLWMSTNVGYLLRGMGMKQVVMVGALTDQCVESAIRDACDDSAPQPPSRSSRKCATSSPADLECTRVVLALVVRKGDDKNRHALLPCGQISW